MQLLLQVKSKLIKSCRDREVEVVLEFKRKSVKVEHVNSSNQVVLLALSSYHCVSLSIVEASSSQQHSS